MCIIPYSNNIFKFYRKYSNSKSETIMHKVILEVEHGSISVMSNKIIETFQERLRNIFLVIR